MLKDFLQEKKIAFENVDVGGSREAALEMREKSGQMGVPVVDIDGTIIVGFDREKLIRELGL
jgi:glutaredoxin